MTTDTIRNLIFDGITLHADRVCDNLDGYDRITAWEPDTGQPLVEISWHRDTRQMGLTLHGDRRWSFETVEEMRLLGMDWLWWPEDAVGIDRGGKNSIASAAAG